MHDVAYGEVSWERMIRAVENVRRRLLRAVAALETAGVPYSVVGGQAVAAWVSRVDEAAVRNTRDVDIAACRTSVTALQSIYLPGKRPRPTHRLPSRFQRRPRRIPYPSRLKPLVVYAQTC